MRRANVGRSNSSPFRIEPALGKFSENGCSCWKSKNWRDVFEKQPLDGFQLANESDNVEKQSAALSGDACLATGNAEVLAGESSNDASHSPTIESAWEGSHVGVDRCFVQVALPHASRQNRDCRAFPLAVAEALSAW